MTILSSRVSTSDDEFRLNRQAYEAVIADLQSRRQQALAGGPLKAREKHLARNKILPRHRVEVLLDPGSPFLEVGMLAGEGMYDGVPPGASIITGIGLVQGRACMIIANDATVKGGTYYGMTCKKHVRAQQIAWAHRLPCITLVDSGGAFLPEMANIFPDVGQFGSIFNNQVRMSAEGIQQIAVVMGPCTAGGAYIPALSEYNVIVRGIGAIFLGGPPLVKAATGEEVGVEELGGCDMHTSISGTADYPADNEPHAFAIAREIVAQFRRPQKAAIDWEESEDPYYDPAELYGIIPVDRKVQFEAREVIRRCEVAELEPLNGDMEEYIRLKLKRVGKELADLFDPPAFDAIRARLTLRTAGGQRTVSMHYPLVVNNTVVKCLNLAAEIGAPKVSADIVQGV